MRIVQDTMPSGPVANTDEEAPQGGNSFSSVMIAKMTHYIQTVEEDQPLMMSWVNQLVELQQHATSHRKVLLQYVESMRQRMTKMGLEPPPPPPAKPGKHGKREKLASEIKASDGCDRRVVIDRLVQSMDLRKVGFTDEQVETFDTCRTQLAMYHARHEAMYKELAPMIAVFQSLNSSPNAESPVPPEIDGLPALHQ
jgi:hypothetical protein